MQQPTLFVYYELVFDKFSGIFCYWICEQQLYEITLTSNGNFELYNKAPVTLQK